MNCEIIAVGSELLTPYRQDTNSLFLTDRLLQLGVNVTFRNYRWRSAGASRQRDSYCPGPDRHP